MIGRTKHCKKLIEYILLCCILVCTSGCGQKEQKSTQKYEGNYIFYFDKTEKEILHKKYKPQNTETLPLIEEFVQELVKETIPKNVIVNSYNLLDGIITLDFSQQYLTVSKEEEVMIRAAVVLTLTQIESVDYVAITVNDNVLTRSDGTIIGNMQATDFVDSYGDDSNIMFQTKFVLYYASPEEAKLKEYELMEKYTGEESKEEFIVRKLIEGPQKKGYNRILSEDTQLIHVITTDNICYVNFGSNFLTEQIAGSPELVIYSIVNSLSELNYVHKVQITVNGSSDIEYKGISLENAFIRNLDYIKTEEGE